MAVDDVLLEFVQQGEDVEKVVLHGFGEVDGVVPVVALEQPDERFVLAFQHFPEFLEASPVPLHEGIAQVLVEERLVVHELQAHLRLGVDLEELAVEDDGLGGSGAVGDLEEELVADRCVLEPELERQHGVVAALLDRELVVLVPAVVGQLGHLHSAVQVEGRVLGRHYLQAAACPH